MELGLWAVCCACGRGRAMMGPFWWGGTTSGPRGQSSNFSDKKFDFSMRNVCSLNARRSPPEAPNREPSLARDSPPNHGEQMTLKHHKIRSHSRTASDILRQFFTGLVSPCFKSGTGNSRIISGKRQPTGIRRSFRGAAPRKLRQTVLSADTPRSDQIGYIYITQGCEDNSKVIDRVLDSHRC